jgi:hypothetical protein
MILATGSTVFAAGERVILDCPAVVVPPAVDTPVGVQVHYVAGDGAIGGFSLGFHYDSDIIEIDSMSSIGSDVTQPAFFTPTLIDTDANTILVGWADFSSMFPLPAGDSGLAFTLWFTVPGGTDNHCVDIDSMFVPPAGEFIFSAQTGGSIVPAWESCGLEDIIIGECGPPTNIPPTAVCQNVTVSADANCEAAVDPAAVDNGSYDDDGTIVSMTLDPAGPYPLGATPVTLTVTDDGDSTDQCQATITVEDNTNPVVTCPATILVGNDAGECGAVVDFAATATDNCDASVDIIYSQDPGTMFPYGLTTVTVTATDDAGNQDQCTFDVQVNDIEDPVAICPADIVIDNDAELCGAVVNFGLDVTDNCTGATVDADFTSGDFFPVGVTTVTVTATDVASNTNQCTFTITVNDVEPPTAICPANIEVGNDPGECGAIVNFALDATDNCPGVTVDADFASGALFPVGVTTVTVTATDGASLTDQCTFDITVNDIEDPVPVCPDNITALVDQGTTEEVVDFAIDATDNCPGVTVSAVPPSGSLFPLGPTTVTVTAEDVAGNTAQCTFTVTITEELIPDFEVTVDVDTLFADFGVATPLAWLVTVTSINSWTDPIDLSYSALPTGVTLGFGTDPVTPTGTSDLTGSTDETTPVGTYPITVTGTVVPPKTGGHEYIVYLVVEGCDEEPIVGLSQTFFDVTITQGQDAADVEVYITNDATCGILDWSASSDQGWAVPNPNAGSVEAGDSPGDLMAIALNTTGLAVGNYTAYVDVSAVTKVANSVQIDLHVEASNDMVWVAENVLGFPGMEVVVPVTFENNELLAGMSVGLMWDDPILYLDSVSYVGSRVDYVSFKTDVIDNGAQTIGTGLFVNPGTEPQIPIGTGQWFNLHFTVDGSAVGGTVVNIDSMFIETNPGTGIELIFNDSLGTEIYPQFVAGSVVIDDSPQFLCGTVTDEFGNPIPFAEVELYEVYPTNDPPLQITTADINGYFCFDLTPEAAGKGGFGSAAGIDDVVYYIRVYQEGFYPNVIETTFPNGDIVLTLPDNGGEVTPTLEWVDLYCAVAYFDDMLLPLGTVIEAFDPLDNICGQWTVVEEGRYGFMPVYTDDPWSPEDEGCDTNDVITLKVNGFEVEPFNAPLIWVGNGARIETCFEGYSIIEVCIDLVAGWNLISWNVDSEFDDVDSIFQLIMPFVDVILGFEAEGLTYDPDLVEFSTLHEADHLHGFWVRMEAPFDELCVKGLFVDPMTPIALETNWNLVSYLPNDTLPTEDALISIWSNLVVALAFDAAGVGATSYDTDHPELATLLEMSPFFGYWLKVDAAIDLIYPDMPVFFVSEPADATYAKQSDVPTVAVNNTWINLYGADVTVDGQSLPVGAVIQAVNESDLLVGEFVVTDAGRFGFMPVYGADLYEGGSGSAGETIRLVVDGVEAQETVTWTNNGDRIKVDKFHLTSTAAGDESVLPDQFILGQNFPNPFNPETAIEYTLGRAGQVELAIYNVLGTRIKTLVSDYQAQGTHTVKWYGDNESGERVASGVYFYKLIADEFSETKKMMLLK